MLVAEVVIPQMFTTYAEDLGYRENGLHHFQYFCENCDQAFTSAWGKKTGAMSWYERGDYFHCPHCSTRHEKHVVCIKRQVQAPYRMRLSVKVYKNVVTLEVFSTTVQFQDFLSVFGGSCKEVFRFNIAKQTVLFTRYRNKCKIESLEIGNPFQLDVFKKSILGFFMPNSLANATQKAEIHELIKVLRESVHRKLEQCLGHKVSSMYVSSGRHHGTFLLPIFNMAYRVMFPDAPNLPVVYRESTEAIQQFWELKRITDTDFMDEVIKLTRCKVDFVTALTAVKSLPNRPVVRKILAETHFEIGLLSDAFALCKNYDYAVRMYDGFRNFKTYENGYLNEGFLQFLRDMTPLYGESGITNFVEKAKELELKDCVRLYRQLNEENRQALKTERVKLKDLHDWMALVHRRQTHLNLKFSVPEHIVKRLSMQTERLRFFLPKESLELLEAGTELHNCVASYGEAMKNNRKWVVLVADDRGKLAACLEVQGKKLVQAKIDMNKPVASDAKLNAEVIAWAKETNIEISTKDLKLETEELISMAG